MENLETLDLKGTSIKELPSSIDRLTQLSLLHLGNCEAIASLPHSFFSLTSLSALVLSVVEVEWSTTQSFAYSNCWKLDEVARVNIIANAQLRIQWDGIGASVNIWLSGSEIPKWFNDQNEGSIVTMELPPNWCSKFLGFGFGIVVAFNDYYDYIRFDLECKCKFETVDGDCNEFDVSLYGLDSEYKPKSLCLDHLFVLYNHRMCAMVIQGDDGDDGDHRFSTYQSCHKASSEFSLLNEDLDCKLKK
ncbi:hypothetical protein EZV62_024997 [Acer yangbiense]|uniref:C-JID domain-containing protein n=1 Tax=Acer yangbiense TaxID=1000413 RepID=A0A5C7GXT9_9ROSI|nr:hypothetical protein EZV62_024997 [Acer yangbiense]